MIKQSNQSIKFLNELKRDYESKISLEAEKVQKAIIIPFCNKRKISFVSGMGAWFFFWDDVKGHSIDQDTLPKYITDLLDTYTCNSFCFGEYVSSYQYNLI